jgi:arylsulfatase A-like enzyme
MSIACGRVAAVALIALTACAPAAEPRPNVLLIVVDTLRADHLGTYGYARRETSPHIDALAERSVRFERAYAAAAWTLPSIASILTGLAPPVHGANRPGARLGDGIETVAESFRAAGFATAGVVSNAHLLREVGFAQGFDLWSEDHARGHEYVSSRGVTRDALEMLEQLSARDAPWFLFVHYFDPHFAYLDHPDFAFAAGGAPLLDGTQSMRELENSVTEWSEADRQFLIGRYDEEIRVTDAAIGELLGGLAAAGLEDRTLIVFTADHGEAFGEQDEIGHGTLREEVIRVPLILKPPHSSAAREISEPVSLLAIAATLLEIAEVRHDPASFGAASLASRLSDPATERAAEPVFSEILWTESVVDGDDKLVLDRRQRRATLYDLASDPGETRDISRKRAAARARLTRLIRERGAQLRRPEPAVREIDPEMRERLRQLGYTEQGGPAVGPP